MFSIPYPNFQSAWCRPYSGRLLDLCLSGSRLVGVVFVGVNLMHQPADKFSGSLFLYKQLFKTV